MTTKYKIWILSFQPVCEANNIVPKENYFYCNSPYSRYINRFTLLSSASPR